ncbi:splicing suppressor [Schizosaccharomyces japonicus yFS275]|uniref:Splicing suppressor n=1 Tax=Schizosaccharomyces japonicus (strain yFS275 / FY16936) TaxID=402676 RepID=B6K300_SCHJY|nr:splicing suppressor [Schizosaccharomyces japonicus yFS275]EEB07857.1 splicing suppressor [Schizosaccharomyces japonicus yFS275]
MAQKLFSFGRSLASSNAKRPYFYPLSKSPVKVLRERGERIRKLYKCPVSKLPVEYECPECGFPTHHSQIEWKKDTSKEKFIPKLREINEDEHDLALNPRTRQLFDLPGENDPEQSVSFYSWDSFLYTRSFQSVDDAQQRRHLSRLLTYPITLAAILHELSPYTLRDRLTPQGLQSLSAIRSILHRYPRAQSTDPRPTRIFIIGARGESALPLSIWYQGLNCLFPNRLFQLHFIGPEVMEPVKKEWLPSSIEAFYYPQRYHELHNVGTFEPFDAYYDIFYLPTPAFSQPVYRNDWIPTLHALVETRCPIFLTSSSVLEMENDVKTLKKHLGPSIEPTLTLGTNVFASQAWSVNDANLHDITHVNAQVYGFRATQYNVQEVDI